MAKIKRLKSKTSSKIINKPEKIEEVVEKLEGSGEEESYDDVSDDEFDIPAKKKKVSFNDVDEEEDDDDDEDKMVVVQPKKAIDEEDVDEHEIKIAIEAGLIKVDESIKPQDEHVVSKSKYIVINKEATEKRLETLLKKKLPWLATVDVNISEDIVFNKNVSEDFEREEVFLKQAKDAAEKAVTKLQAEDITVLRPDTYISQMIKSNNEIKRIQQNIEEEIKNGGENKKQKKLNVVKKVEKGRTKQLKMMLQNAARLEEFNDDTAAGKNAGALKPKRKISRAEKNKLYSMKAKIKSGEFEVEGSKRIGKILKKQMKKR